MVRIAIIYDSAYGHILTLAKKVQEGVNSVEGVTADLFKVPEITADGPPVAGEDVPVVDVEKLPEYDGFIFGFPTRFGSISGRFKSFLDGTGGLWATGALVGKSASIFTSSGSQGGGIETTVLTSLTVLAHHGMVFVPTGYSFGEKLFSNEAVRGGTAYGASTIAGGDGSRQPSELELDYAVHQGKYVAGITKKLAA